MLRYLLHLVATMILVVGVVGTVLAPANGLDLCAQIAWLSCRSSDLAFTRFALGGTAALAAGVLWMIGSMVRR